MSIRERTGEVAVMRWLGFAPHLLQLLFFTETVRAAGSWVPGTPAAYGLVFALGHS